MSVNKVILVGRLGQNPELKYTPSGMPVCNFSLATSESWKDKNSGQRVEKAEWHRIVVWSKLAEFCNQYLTKGKQIYLEGKIRSRSWDDKDGNKRYTTEILAQSIQFVGAAPTATAGAAGVSAGASASNANFGGGGNGGADIPGFSDSDFFPPFDEMGGGSSNVNRSFAGSSSGANNDGSSNFSSNNNNNSNSSNSNNNRDKSYNTSNEDHFSTDELPF